jgi:peptidyl-prolyl cis-trans isomerase D
MLATFRRHLNSWVARLFFLMLVATFVLWGVGDVIRNLGSGGALAVVAGHKIQLAEVQRAYQRQMAQVTQMLGGKIDPTPEMKRGVAGQALEQVITQAALNGAVTDTGVGVSEDALRQAVADIPAFHGPNGQFDRATYQAVLSNNNMTEPQLLTLLRSDLGQRQLMGAVRAGTASPETLTKAVFQFQQEKRVANAVQLPFSAAPAPPAPTEEQLTRWYENHKENYSTPGNASHQGRGAFAGHSCARHPGHGRRPASRLRRAQGRVRAAGKALGAGAVGAGRGEGQGAGSAMVSRGRLGDDPEG